MQNLILSTCSIDDLISRIVLEIEANILDRQKSPPPPPDSERWMNLRELCDYLPDRPKPQTVYSWVSNKVIPVNKGSKHLRFLKSEIDQWLKSGRRKTYAEIRMESQKAR